MSVKDAMRGYFDRLLLACRATGREWPVTPWDEDADPVVYAGEPDEDEMVAWRPVERGEPWDAHQIDSIHGAPVRAEIREYVSAYWFCAMGGRFGGLALELEPVVPGSGLDPIARKFAGYVAAHGGETRFVPLGTETGQGRLLVIDNATGEVFLEDWETGRQTWIASGIQALIAGLRV